ncbi:epoxide hydrolase family protein [Kibdelosporangium aridum]|uniref:Pimeloyl-ACP methyl ester carboxylesterase n=1 Tax=Kibdelosporangium aridum TaxID=2030 RepID=A0A1Y5YA32_KIBAR|nr:epoxide hydrolase family protein [Kibdelosporangium aridum]SMD26720.1 Pimeloyl-ACP methyl ester carboxylesterase [Kibdelosporangium aridum]
MSRLSRRGLLGAGAAAPLGLLGMPAYAEETTFSLPPATDAVTPFRLRVPDSVLIDLKRRLAATRWPERETVDDVTQGAQLEKVRKLVAYWLTRYDWRRVEARLNGFGQFRTRIDGLGIHFLHVRSKHRDAIPILLSHGWPGSVVEFLNVIGPLTDPTAFGGKAEDAFHVVVPSLPGYGFSDKPSSTGWNVTRTANAWAVLMKRLGYTRWLAQGGDWGGAVTAELAKIKPAGLAGIHLNFFATFNPPVSDPPTPEELEALAKLEKFQTDGSGYFTEHATRPQQVGYSLSDSPTGQAAWIYEKFSEWTDSDFNPESVLGYDQMLDDIMLYWLPATGASSARFYWEFGRSTPTPDEFHVPIGFTVFPREILPLPRIWAERVYKDNLIYFNRVARGGHFAAFEQPEIFTDEVRKFARLLR